MAIRDAIPIEDGDKTNRKKDTQEPILENSMMSIEVKARTKNVYDINEELIKNNVFYPTITSLQVYHYLLIIFLPVKLCLSRNILLFLIQVVLQKKADIYKEVVRIFGP